MTMPTRRRERPVAARRLPVRMLVAVALAIGLVGVAAVTPAAAIEVSTAPVITSADSATFSVGTQGSFLVTATGSPGGPTLTISIGNGTLPTGLTFTDNGDGTATLAGTPAAGTGGFYQVNVTAANGVAPDATQQLFLTIRQAPSTPAFVAGSLSFSVGVAGSVTFGAEGVPGSFIAVSGSLPTGFTITGSIGGSGSTLTLSGTPEAGSGGSYPITLSVDNGTPPASSLSVVLTVDEAPAITTADTATFPVGVSSSFLIQSTGFPDGAGLTVSDGGATLPSGVQFVPGVDDGTAHLVGRPNPGVVGSYPITLTASNGVSPDASQPFVLVVSQGSQAISFTGPATGTAGGSATLAATGGASGNPVTFSVDATSGAGVCATSGTDGTTLTYTGTGSCVIDADQAGNADYLAAPTVTRTVAVVAAAAAAGAFLAAAPGGSGYWIADPSGGVTPYGSAASFGSMAGRPLNRPVAGIAATPDGKGYWLVASDGGVFAFGDAAFYGSMGGSPLNEPVVDIASTPDGRGYWLVASDGGVFAFGDAAFSGSSGGLVLDRPMVGMASTPDGRGYWLVGSDGGVFAYGDATFYGSAGSQALLRPIVGLAAAPGGHGYWLVASDGGVFAYGSAAFHGSKGGVITVPYLGLFPVTGGYTLVDSSGTATRFTG
jgi:hypothetical protein